MTYWAFISYSHRDTALATWLHRSLETYRIPSKLVGRTIQGYTVPRRLTPIFRDRDELPTTSNLSAAIRKALEESSALIVICSTASAASRWVNEEVRTFRALGRGDRIFALVVDGEPNASLPDGAPAPNECFPLSLRSAPSSTGDAEGEDEPGAADIRPGKDKRSDAVLKLVAGIIGTGFDELKGRHIALARRRMVLRSSLSALAVATLAVTGAALADADFTFPGSASIQRRLDHYGLSVFRPVPTPLEIADAAASARAALRPRLVDTRTMRPGSIGLDQLAWPIDDKRLSVWELGQVTAAAFRDPDISPDQLRPVPAFFDQMFRSYLIVRVDGKPVEWHEGATPYGATARAESAIWMMLSLVAAASRKDIDAIMPAQTLRQYLDVSQEIAESYYPLEDGGWNVVARRDNPKDHNFYVSGLALHMLLELRSAGLCWRGDCDRLDRMIAASAQFLYEQFENGESGVGWRHSMTDDKSPTLALGAIIFGSLARSGKVGKRAGNPGLLAIALRQLEGIRHRPYHPSREEIKQYSISLDAAGRERSSFYTSQLVWYPWMIETLSSFIDIATQQDFPPEVQAALRRSLGHMLTRLSGDMIREMHDSRIGLFAVAETHYGLTRVYQHSQVMRPTPAPY